MSERLSRFCEALRANGATPILSDDGAFVHAYNSATRELVCMYLVSSLEDLSEEGFACVLTLLEEEGEET